MPLSVEEVLETYWDDIEPLRNPVMLVALRGLFDIGGVATSALDWMLKERDFAVVADIDPDPFFDFTQERPEVFTDTDGDRQIRWPENEFTVIRYPEGARDMVVLNGVEPHVSWAVFTQSVVEVAKGLGCTLVISLGAAAEQVPHSRVPFVVGSTTNSDLASRLGLSRPQYQGPTGVAGVLLDALDQAKIPNISLRVGVPHYLMHAQHPKSAAALLQHLQHVLGIPTDHANLQQEISRWQELHDAAVEGDPQASAYVQMLEHRHDQLVEQNMPSGDDLAAELEEFLRNQSNDE
ncbi:MAG: PAC2 family protein [Ilumatobacteraceae bacterium]|jgi:proteasome assembly chaperone (PAC2) family protein|nr:PAC2 family protein [Ilumatobacteraceae bacterium]